MSEDCWTYRQIGNVIGVSSSVVTRVIRRYREYGQYSRLRPPEGYHTERRSSSPYPGCQTTLPNDKRAL